MALSQPRDSTIGVVGDGFGSLMVLSAATYLGFDRNQVTVFGPSTSPVATYAQSAFNLGQTILRSESESHFLPADWPTFAQLEAWARKRPSPLLRSIRRRYNPGVPDMLAQATVVAEALGWDDHRMPVRIGWLQRAMDPAPHFVLYDESGCYVGRATHVAIATGHSPLSFPPVLARARADAELGQRIVQAYEAKAYVPAGRYIVVGAGIAAINEWVNALDVGAKVISLLRSPEPEDQDLNAPRCLFEARGIDAFQGLPFDDRLRFLGTILKGTAPHRRSWEDTVGRARAEGRFEGLMGEIDAIEPGPAGLRAHLVARGGSEVGWLDVTGIVAATGFNKSALSTPLLRRLVEHYGVPLEGGRIRLKPNCGVPGLDLPESRLCMIGIHANVVVPHGDTIAGVKYISRRFVGDCARAERVRPRPFRSRVQLQLALSRRAAAAVRQARREEQLA